MFLACTCMRTHSQAYSHTIDCPSGADRTVCTEDYGWQHDGISLGLDHGGSPYIPSPLKVMM